MKPFGKMWKFTEHLINHIDMYIVGTLLLILSVLSIWSEVNDNIFIEQCDDLNGIVIESVCVPNSTTILLRN